MSSQQLRTKCPQCLKPQLSDDEIRLGQEYTLSYIFCHCPKSKPLDAVEQLRLEMREHFTKVEKILCERRVDFDPFEELHELRARVKGARAVLGGYTSDMVARRCLTIVQEILGYQVGPHRSEQIVLAIMSAFIKEVFSKAFGETEEFK